MHIGRDSLVENNRLMVDKLRLARLVKVYEAMWRALSGLEWRKPGAGSVVRTLEDEAAINGTSIEQHNRIINLSDHFPTIEIKIISGLVNEKNQLDSERLQQDLYWAFVLLNLVDKSYDALPLAILGMPSLAGSKPNEKAINRFLELAYANDPEGKKIAAALFEQLKERTAGLSEGERNNRNQVMQNVYERFGLGLVYKSHQQYQGYDEEIVEHLLQPKTLVQLAQDLINAGWSNEQALGFFPNEMHLALLEALIKVRVGEQPVAEQQLIKPTGISEAEQQEFGDIFNPVPLDQAYDPQRLNPQARQQLIDAVRLGNPDEFRKVLSESNCSINSKTNRINFLPQSNNVVREGNYRAVIADVGIKIEAIAGRLALEKFNHNMQEGGFFKRLWRRSIYYRWARPTLLKRYAGEFEQALSDLVNNGTAIDNNKLPELGNEFARKGIPLNSAESFLANLDNIAQRIDEQQKLGAVVTDAFDANETPSPLAHLSPAVQKAIADIKDLVFNYIQNSGMPDEQFNSVLRPILNSIREELNAKVLGSNLLAKAKELRNAYARGEGAAVVNMDNLLEITFSNAREADVHMRKVGGRINQAVTKVINKTQSIPVARWFTSPMALGLGAFLGVNVVMGVATGTLGSLLAPALAIAIPIGVLAGMRQNAEVNQNYQQVDLRQSLGLTTATATKLEQRLNAAVVDKLDVQKAIKDLQAGNPNKDNIVNLIGDILARITQGRKSGIELFKYAPGIDEEKQKVDLLRSVNSLIVGLNLTPDELKKSQQDETAKLQQKINTSNRNFRSRKSREVIQAVAISAGTAVAFGLLLGWAFRGWKALGQHQPLSQASGTTASANKEVTYTLQEFLTKNSDKLNTAGLQNALKQAGVSNPDKITADLLSGGKVSVQKLISYLNSYSVGNQKAAAALEKYIEGVYGIDIQFTSSKSFLQALWQAAGVKEQLQHKGIKDFAKFTAAFEKEMSNPAKGSWSLSGTLKGILGSNRLAKDAETIILQGINKSPALRANLEEVLRQNDFLASQGSIQRFFENFTDGGRVIGSTMARYKQFMVDPVKFHRFMNKALGIYKTAGTNSNWAQAGNQLRSLLWKDGVLNPADRVNIAFDWVHRFSGWNVKAVEGNATNDFLNIFFNITRIAQPIKLTEAAAAVEQTVAGTAKALGYFLGPMLSGAPYYGLGVLALEESISAVPTASIPTPLAPLSPEPPASTTPPEIPPAPIETVGTGRDLSDNHIIEDHQDLQAARNTLSVLMPDLKQAEEKSAELEKQLKQANQDFASAEDAYLQAKAEYEKADKIGEVSVDIVQKYNDADRLAEDAAETANSIDRALVSQRKLIEQLQVNRVKHIDLIAQIAELEKKSQFRQSPLEVSLQDLKNLNSEETAVLSDWIEVIDRFMLTVGKENKEDFRKEINNSYERVKQLIEVSSLSKRERDELTTKVDNVYQEAIKEIDGSVGQQAVPTPATPPPPAALSQPASQVEQSIKPGSDFKPISAKEQKVDYIPPPAELKPVGISPKSEIIDIESSPELPLPQSQPQVPPVSSSLVDNKGGIDLTHMPAAIMRQPGVINPTVGLTPALSREIFSINLNQECGQIEKMMAADIAVSDERLRVLMIVCCRSFSSVRENLDKMRDYIAFKIRIDEKFCRPTNTALLKMLELLELNQPPEVMINTLASLSIAPK